MFPFDDVIMSFALLLDGETRLQYNAIYAGIAVGVVLVIGVVVVCLVRIQRRYVSVLIVVHSIYVL